METMRTNRWLECLLRFAWTGVLGFFVVLGLAGPAAADIVSLQASKDNSLYSESGSLSNGAGNYFFAGRTNSGNTRRGLIAFDVAAATPGRLHNPPKLRSRSICLNPRPVWRPSRSTES